MKPVIVAIPATLLVMASVGGATAQITTADPTAVRNALMATGTVLLIASATTGDLGAILGTLAAISAVVYATRGVWPWGASQ
jgi:hypothetical protein